MIVTIVNQAGPAQHGVLSEGLARLRAHSGRKVLLLGQAARIMSDLPADLELDRLVALLWARRSADPSDEVQDPYKRGPEAMATAARQIDAAMDVIAPALEHIAQR